MLVLVSYDVAQDDNGAKRLRKVAKTCESFGQRVQYSVFECLLDPGQWAKLKAKLEDSVDEKYDSLRYYYLGKNWERRVEHFGAKASINFEKDVLIL